MGDEAITDMRYIQSNRYVPIDIGLSFQQIAILRMPLEYSWGE